MSEQKPGIIGPITEERAAFFDADTAYQRLMAGEAPVLHTGESPFTTLVRWMREAGDLDPEDPEAGS